MNTKQVIVVRRDLNMRKGKIAAQVAHASMAFLTKGMMGSDADELRVHLTPEQKAWLSSGFAKVVCYVENQHDLYLLIGRARGNNLTVHEVVDSGRTEFHGVPTLTCVALGPHRVEAFEGVSDMLPLL